MAISLNRKEAIRQQHPLYGQVRIQVAHIVDRFKGGTDEDENLTPKTVPEHILDHVTKAMSETDRVNMEKQYGSAHLLAVNATEEEIKEANRLLAQMPRRR
jgi:hypothetical protein